MRHRAAASRLNGRRGGRDLRDMISYQLARFVNINDRLDQAHVSEAFGITLGEWRVFATIHFIGPVSLADLGRQMLVDKGQSSRVVRRLVERGWVNNHKTPGNRRSITLSLMPEGRKKYREIIAFVAKRNDVLQSVLTPRERTHLSKMLERLTTFGVIEFAALASGSANDAERIAKQQTRGLNPKLRRVQRRAFPVYSGQ